MFKINRDIKIITVIIISSLVYSFNVNVFVESGGLFPGGFSGTALLISRIADTFFEVDISFSLIYICMNLIVTLLIYKHIGKKFLRYSILHFVLCGVFTYLLPSFPITEDILLISVFGGIFNGIAISMALTVNASSGGTDFIAIYASSKYNIQTWNYVMVFNAIIIICGGFLFGWDKSLYSIIYQFCSTTIINNRHRRYKLNQLIIITDKPEGVSAEILRYFRHGITRLSGEGMYSHQDKHVLMITCNAFQVNDIVKHIKLIDDCAFINISAVEKVVGNFYQLPLE